MMNTVIRTHCKNTARLNLLEKTIISWYDKHLDDLGGLYLADDQSPMKQDVIMLAQKYNASYSCSGHKPSTNNGLAHALISQNNFPSLQLVDDTVFATGIKDRIQRLLDDEIQYVGDWGVIGLFLPIGVAHLRSQNQKLPDANLYKIDASSWLFHAWTTHIFSDKLAKAYIEHWDTVKGTDKEDVHLMDDHRARIICHENKLSIHITELDYSWHTGTRDRSFDDHGKQGGSDYQAAMFAGSEADKGI